MTKEQIYATAKDFVSFIESGAASSVDSIPRLVMLVDHLAFAYHFTDYPFDDVDYGEPPEKRYQQLRKHVEGSFPDLGFYNLPLKIDSDIPDSEVVLGDAIDDIVDIANDLKEFVWRWENTSQLDALWHFRFGFTAHWGTHLRSLQLYLHTREP